jgi:hypothetical protein
MSSPKRRAVGEVDWSAQTNVSSLHKRFQQPTQTTITAIPAPSSNIRERAKVPASLGIIGKQTSLSAAPVALEIKVDAAMVDSMVKKLSTPLTQSTQSVQTVKSVVAQTAKPVVAPPIPSNTGTSPKRIIPKLPVLQHQTVDSPTVVPLANPLVKQSPTTPIHIDIRGRGADEIKRKLQESQDTLSHYIQVNQLHEQRERESKERELKMSQERVQIEQDCVNQLKGYGFLAHQTKNLLQIMSEKAQVLAPEAFRSILATAHSGSDDVSDSFDKDAVQFKDQFSAILKRIEERQQQLMETQKRADLKERQWKVLFMIVQLTPPSNLSIPF